MGIIRRDLKDMGITWDEAEELATDRAEWHQCVARCTQDELKSKVRSISRRELIHLFRDFCSRMFRLATMHSVWDTCTGL